MSTTIVNSTELKKQSSTAGPAQDKSSPVNVITNRKTTHPFRIQGLMYQPLITMFFILMGGGLPIILAQASEGEGRPVLSAKVSNGASPKYLPNPIAISNDISSEPAHKIKISTKELTKLLKEHDYALLWNYILNSSIQFSPPAQSRLLRNREFLMFGLNNGKLSKLFKTMGPYLVVNDRRWIGIRHDEILYELLTNPHFASQEVRNHAEVNALADFKKAVISKEKMNRTWSYLNNLSPKTLKRIGINEDFYLYKHYYQTENSFRVEDRLWAKRHASLWSDLIKHYEIFYPDDRQMLLRNSEFIIHGFKSGQFSKLFKVRFRSDDGWPSNRFVGEYLVNDDAMWQVIRSHDDILHTLLAKPDFAPRNVRDLARHKARRDRRITRATNPKAWSYVNPKSSN